VVGGSANAYDYAAQDGVNGLDLDGRKLICNVFAFISIVGSKIYGHGSANCTQIPFTRAKRWSFYACLQYSGDGANWYNHDCMPRSRHFNGGGAIAWKSLPDYCVPGSAVWWRAEAEVYNRSGQGRIYKTEERQIEC
jgi:hypothetical protein